MCNDLNSTHVFFSERLDLYIAALIWGKLVDKWCKSSMMSPCNPSIELSTLRISGSQRKQIWVGKVHVFFQIFGWLGVIVYKYILLIGFQIPRVCVFSIKQKDWLHNFNNQLTHGGLEVWHHEHGINTRWGYDYFGNFGLSLLLGIDEGRPSPWCGETWLTGRHERWDSSCFHVWNAWTLD